MRIYVKDRCELLAAAVLAAVGVAIIGASLTYKLGTAFNMGPGYFPLILGVILTGLSLIVAFGSLSHIPSGRNSEEDRLHIDAKSLWALAVVGAGFIGFAILLPLIGLAATCFSVLVATGIASALLRPLEAVVTAAVLTTISIVLFIYLLGLQIQTWPW